MMHIVLISQRFQNLVTKVYWFCCRKVKGAERSGHTSPSHRISPKLLQVLETHENKRVFVSVYTQSVYRIQEIIDCCMASRRKMVFYSKELRDLVGRLKRNWV